MPDQVLAGPARLVRPARRRATAVVLALGLAATLNGPISLAAAAAPEKPVKIKAWVKSSRKFGIDIASVPAGRYKIVVNDTTSQHNFHLTGPGGIDLKTDRAGVGKEVWKVDLVPGTYNAVCDPHSSWMKLSFQVT